MGLNAGTDVALSLFVIMLLLFVHIARARDHLRVAVIEGQRSTQEDMPTDPSPSGPQAVPRVWGSSPVADPVIVSQASIEGLERSVEDLTRQRDDALKKIAELGQQAQDGRERIARLVAPIHEAAAGIAGRWPRAIAARDGLKQAQSDIAAGGERIDQGTRDLYQRAVDTHRGNLEVSCAGILADLDAAGAAFMDMNTGLFDTWAPPAQGDEIRDGLEIMARIFGWGTHASKKRDILQRSLADELEIDP